MQTFLPFKDFFESAQALDNKRLNKQILEGYQILKVLNNNDPKAAWRNHPAVKMWRGHEGQLWLYIMNMVDEANKRGIKTDKNMDNLKVLKAATAKNWGWSLPNWYRDPFILAKVLTTHKANLYKKDPTYYSNFVSSTTDENNSPCCPTCSYYWVTHIITKENK
ncbi:MAG: hypothetical protein EBR82_26080 [Caulobacteraceae bacterium]|nr:hypothetical protein [Caulobacteraceae bacterium]